MDVVLRPLLLAAAAVGALATGACSSAQHATSPASTDATSSRPAPLQPVSTQPTTPSPSGSATGPYERALAWSDLVHDDVTAIQQSTDAISQAAGKQDVAALKDLCIGLRQATTKLSADPAPPDTQMRQAVADAVSAYSAAATSCLAGNYGATADAITAGASYLNQANNIMNNLGD